MKVGGHPVDVVRGAGRVEADRRSEGIGNPACPDRYHVIGGAAALLRHRVVVPDAFVKASNLGSATLFRARAAAIPRRLIALCASRYVTGGSKPAFLFWYELDYIHERCMTKTLREGGMPNDSSFRGTGPGFRRGKILPPFVSTKTDLDKTDANGVTYRKLWTNVAIMHFDNNINKPVGYTITDDMIVAYSRQFKDLRDKIRDHVAKMKTWQQLADPNLPMANYSYFTQEWRVAPIRNGPVDGACGCGCGCACA